MSSTTTGVSNPRVCLVLMYFTIGGLERVVVDLANGLARRGLSTRVIIFETGKRNALITELDDRVELHCLEGGLVSKLRELRRLARDHVVHFHFGDGKIQFQCRLALLGHPKLVITYHSVYSHLLGRLRSRLHGLLSSQFRAVIVVSERVRYYCVEELGIASGMTEVIRNGIAVPEAARPGGSRRFTIITVASLYPHKNQATLLRAVALARQKIDLRLVVVGDGPDMARLFRLARELGLAQVIEWHGALWRRDAVAALLSSADVFATASRFEGFSIALLEAMACGLPIVASDIAPHREAVGDSAALCAPTHVEAFARAFVDLAQDDDRRTELSRDARARAASFSLDAFIDRHVAVYQSISR